MDVTSGKQPPPGRYARAFSERVRMARARERMTEQALADACGMSRTYLGKRLRDDVPFTLNDMEVLCRVLRIKPPKLPVED
jgi:transcriptional regulator with XRE-family HTH domain